MISLRNKKIAFTATVLFVALLLVVSGLYMYDLQKADAAAASTARFCVDLNSNTSPDPNPRGNCVAGNYTTGDFELIPFDQSTGVLAVGLTSPQTSGSWTAVSGEHTAYLCADVGGAVAESDEGLGIAGVPSSGNCIEYNFIIGAGLPYVPADPVTVDIKLDGFDLPANYTEPANYNLSWITGNNPNTCKASDNWIGNKAVSGGNEPMSAIPAGVYTYTISCFGGLDYPTATPIVVGATSVSDLAYAIDVVGDYAYIVSGPAGDDLEIFDVSDSENPFKVSGIDTTTALGIDVVGSYAYVVGTNYTDGTDLQVFNISDPLNPTREGGANTGNTTRDIVVSGNYAYVVKDGGGPIIDEFQVFDISNPSAPNQVAAADLADSGRAIELQGNYAYITSSNDSGIAGDDIEIFDISNPLNPTKVGGIDMNANAWDVAVSGNYAYLALDSNTGSELRVIDVSNPAGPSDVGGAGMGTSALGVALYGNFAYVSSVLLGDDLEIFDISDPLNVTKIGGADAASTARSLYLSGDSVYVINDSLISGLEIFANMAKDEVAVAVAVAVDDSCTITGDYAVVPMPAGTVIRDGATASEAVSNWVSVTIPAGTYEIQLESYDGYLGRSLATQPNEHWRLEMKDINDVSTFTGTSIDLPDGVDYVKNQTVVTSPTIFLPVDIKEVRASHPDYFNAVGDSSVRPVCAAFNLIPMPNLTLPSDGGITPSVGWDRATGFYNNASVDYTIKNDGSANAGSFEIKFNSDFRTNVPTAPAPTVSHIKYGSEAGLNFTPPGNSISNTQWLYSGANPPGVPPGIPPGDWQVLITVDHDDDVDELDESVADNTRLVTGSGPTRIKAPNPGIQLSIDPDFVRYGETTTLNYDINATYDMICTIDGPSITTQTFNPHAPVQETGSFTTGPITAKSEFLLKCTEQISGYGDVFTATAVVETTGIIEER